MRKIKSTKIEPKTVFYQTNGTGRDTYISTDNGGTVSGKRPMKRNRSSYFRLKTQPTSRPKSAAKVINYHNDGTGRDVYVGCNSGGLLNFSRKFSDYKNFITSLRHYDLPNPKKREMSSNSTRGAFDRNNLKISGVSINSRRFKIRQKNHVDFLSKPKRRSVPFYKWCKDSSDRKNLIRRKNKIKNNLYNIF